MNAAVRKLHRQSGVTMIEYALIAALIGVVAITTLTAIGTKVNTKFTAVSTALQ
ncbi:MAG: Flp family type IVb pilin [Rhodocyclaceae bacterium]|nr:Flp family type IVb pilin [Rhodocyclaceae bacterium]